MAGTARRRRVERYDGQAVWIGGEAVYEMGNYLGGGAAGVVYEATHIKAPCHEANRNVAVKILNPVGFKLMQNGTLQRCLVARKGAPLPLNTPMGREHVWWVVHPNSRAVIAAQPEPRTGQLRELPLPRCIEIWGWDPLNQGGGFGGDGSTFAATPQDGPSATPQMGHGGGGTSDEAREKMDKEAWEKMEKSGDEVLVDGSWVTLPRVPAKFLKWLRARQGIYREIANMSHLGAHRNVVALHEVLEYVQDSKSTLFLVLELVTGGELFERIKCGCGTSSDVAKRYFHQLLDGVGYCHEKGVCHRDLKPENLLLSDTSEAAVLKIADFGLSAAFAIAAHGEDSARECGPDTPGCFSSPSSRPPSPTPQHQHQHEPGFPRSPLCMRRLRSVVGSPHYVAPEVTTESVQGYDGPKADVWSAGVILYTMLAGTLPFDKDLSRCPRFAMFNKWVAARDAAATGATGGGGGGSPNTPAAPSTATTSAPSALPSPSPPSSSPASSALLGGLPAHASSLPASLPVPPLLLHTLSYGGGGAGEAGDTADVLSLGGDASGGVSGGGSLDWFFPRSVSEAARALIVGLLHFDPQKRLTITDASRHPWMTGGDNGAAQQPGLPPPPPQPPLHSQSQPPPRMSRQPSYPISSSSQSQPSSLPCPAGGASPPTDVHGLTRATNRLDLIKGGGGLCDEGKADYGKRDDGGAW